MDWIVFLLLSIAIIVIVTHLLALTLLFKLKEDNLNGTQKYLLVSLCLTELTLGVNSIIFICCSTFIHIKLAKTITELSEIFSLTPLTQIYFSIIILITLDRLLEFRLNIKYSLYWSSKKTLVTLLVTVSISISTFICVLVVRRFYNFTFNIYEKIVLEHVMPAFSNSFILLALYTYYQIYKKVKENREKNKRIKQMFEVKHSHKQIDFNRRKRFQVFLPSLIMASFILFIAVPYTIWRIHIEVCNDCNNNLDRILYCLFLLAFLADPMIYIFSLKSVRMKIKRTFPRLNNENTVQNNSLSLSNKDSISSKS